MAISKEFIQAELDGLQQEFDKVKAHLLKLDGSITVYRLLLDKFDEHVEEAKDEP